MKLRGFDVLIPVDTTKQSSLKKYMGLLASAPSFVMWMTRHKEGTSTKVCMDFLTKLRRTTRADQKIGMFGFYWGRKYAIRAGLKSNMIELDRKKVPLVDAVVVCIRVIWLFRMMLRTWLCLLVIGGAWTILL